MTKLTDIPAELWIERSEQTDRTHWWRGPLGTYKANNPQGFDHKVMGHQDTVTVEGVILGAFPDLGEVMFSSEEGARTFVHTREEQPDVFYPADRSE